MIRNAQKEMERVLDAAPGPAATGAWSDIVARRWRHGPLHDRVGPMGEHVAMAYRGPPRRIEQSEGGRRRRSITTETTVTLIPQGSAARWDIEGELDVVHLYIAPERLTRVAAEAEVRRDWSLAVAVAEEDRMLTDLIRTFAATVSIGGTIDRLYIDTLSELLCLHLVRGHGAGARRPVADAAAGLAPWQVRRVGDYLTAHIDRQVGLEELAALLGLSAKHLCTAFRQATGEPPHRWIRRRRVEAAQRRLRDSRESVLGIALDLGYASETAFAAMFRGATGVTPGRYRRCAGRADDRAEP